MSLKYLQFSAQKTDYFSKSINFVKNKPVVLVLFRNIFKQNPCFFHFYYNTELLETQTTFGSPLRNREAERFRWCKQCTQEGLSEWEKNGSKNRALAAAPKRASLKPIVLN